MGSYRENLHERRSGMVLRQAIYKLLLKQELIYFARVSIAVHCLPSISVVFQEVNNLIDSCVFYRSVNCPPKNLQYRRHLQTYRLAKISFIFCIRLFLPRTSFFNCPKVKPSVLALLTIVATTLLNRFWNSDMVSCS